ncbi:MAG: hypothetical protein GYB65_06830 [Chloroflexi bacterium]|nr:hypothetical protein [Chloroflexota bacterium]
MVSIRNKRIFFGLVIAALSLSALVLIPAAGAQDGDPERTGFRPDAPPYGVRGLYPVGFRTFSVEVGDRLLEGGIWYPGLNPDGTEEAVTYDLGVGDILLPIVSAQAGRAILDVAPDTANGPYPLVFSSHGLNGQIYFWAYLHEHLASQGFVVMAVWHNDTLRGSLLASTDEQQAVVMQAAIDGLVLRPADVSHTLDYAEMLTGSDGALAGVIDTDRVAAIGMSYGGATSLLAVGARLDFRAVPELCASDVYASLLSTMVCQAHSADLPGLEAHLMELAGVDGTPGQLWPSLGDSRIDAIVAMMPGGGSVFVSAEGYANVEVPALFMKSCNDEISIPAYNVDPAWEYTGSASKSLVTFENAGHAIGGYCDPVVVQTIPAFFPSCSDPVWDMDRAHDLIDHFVTAFLLAELYGDEEAAAALSPDTVQFPGISYETTEF